MSATTDFYLARADESARAAKDATLVNVRERCLRAEAVWRQMADRSIQVDQKKTQDALEKRAAVAAPGETAPWPIAPIVHQKKARS